MSAIEVNGVAASATVVAGFVVPFIVSFIKRENWSAEVKHIISLVVSVVTGVVIVVVDRGVAWNWQEMVASSAVIFTIANTFYSQYFGYTPINSKLERLTIGEAVYQVPVPEIPVGFASAKPVEPKVDTNEPKV